MRIRRDFGDRVVSRLQPEELEDALFLAMLNMSRSNADPAFDLIALCDELKIEVDPMDLLTFTNDNNGIRGTSYRTSTSIRFRMNAEGRRHALSLEKRNRPKTISERFSEIPIGKGIWEIIKIALSAFFGGLTVWYFGIK